jgi:hypothetical protein
MSGVVALVVAAALVVSGGATVSASNSGTVKGSKATAAKVLKDLGVDAPARCIKLRLARADRTFGYYTMATPPKQGCPGGEGGPVFLAKSQGSWSYIAIANNASCDEARSAIRAAGGSTKVAKALLERWSC